MRIPIREQLGLLVLFTSLIALAVIAIATWVTSYNYVVGIRLSGLSLAASLYAEQLASNLALLEAGTQSIATRVSLQSALQRYDSADNNTDANWSRAQTDLASALVGGGTAQYLLQVQVFSKNGTGSAGPYPLVNVTGTGLGQIALPYDYPNGTQVFLGDNDTTGLGYPPSLYPNLTYTSTVVNDTFNTSTAYFNGAILYPNTTIFLGPLQVNSSYALVSITVAVINNTSATDIIGWETIVSDTSLITNVERSTLGLGNTGIVLVVAPATQTNKYPSGILYDSLPKASKSVINAQQVQYALPPWQDPNRSTRHASRAYGKPNTPFALSAYPSLQTAVSKDLHVLNNAGSSINTRNEDNDQVSVGFARADSDMADWFVIVEQAHSEVVQPINHLRNVLIACVFGVVGGILLTLLPLAHYSVRPIRRLRDATKKTVEPYGFSSDDGSVRASSHGDREGVFSGDEDNHAQEAKKEGFVGPLARWKTGRQRTREQKEANRRRRETFRIPGKVPDTKHIVHDELTDLTTTFNEMSEELMMQYERLEERVRVRTQELELSKKAAEAANESKTLFIANISHELKTPLNGILGMCAVCMQEEDQTKIKRSLGIIYKSGDLLLHLLTDLLTFSKNQIGQQLALDEREFRIADISSQILSIFEKQAKEGAINLQVHFEGPHESLETASGTPGQLGYGPYGTGRVRDMCLWGDQHRILQVIINLVSNSLKFTPKGGTVDVRIRCVGEVESERSSSSRKGSTQSRLSKVPSRTSKLLNRYTSGSDQSVPRSVLLDGDNSKDLNTALEINSMEPKSISNAVTYERSPSPAPVNARVLMFEFEVEDSGPGIAPAQQRKVFEPFVQGDLGLSKKFGGTGLGLSICSQLAKLMKGSISLHSEEGIGSRFTMSIPLKYTKERADSTTSSGLNLDSRRNSINMGSMTDEPRTPRGARSQSDMSTNAVPEPVPAAVASPTVVNGFESPASKPRLVGLSQPFFATSPPLDSPVQQLAAMERVAAEASERGDKVRVLVAEDNKVNQEVVLRMLKLEDIYDVTVAKDGQEAFDLVKESMEQKQRFNLIFMDIQMPNLDGLQSTRLIREMGYSAPIVALTAFAEESNVKECMDSGMNFFLPKPIRRGELKKVLTKYCLEAVPEKDEVE